MARATPIWLSWSSGKDSAWALEVLGQRSDVEVVGLLTTLSEESQRIAIHHVRRQLVEAQAEALGLPLHVVGLPWPCANEIYEQRLGSAWKEAARQGVEAIAFGDLFLEDIRAYREAQLAPTGLRPLFPLWSRDTAGLARQMLDGGLKAISSCVDCTRLPATFVGQSFDEAFLAALPPSVDPCGEGGEFHTFVYDGRRFSRPVAFHRGEARREGAWVQVDLLPAPASG